MVNIHKIPEPLHFFAAVFSKAGYSCYLVGGALRNMVMGKKPSDFDFATDASPEEVIRLFRRVVPTGIQHGTVTVLHKNESYEVTTFRIEGDYSDARRPDNVEYTSDIFEDLKRRDFTINAMAINLETGEFLDPFQGKKDIASRVIRAIGNPAERFNEDALRILRAFRFSAQLSFTIDPETFSGIVDCKEKLYQVSAERIRDELEKIILSPTPSKGLQQMEKAGVLPIVLPELSACTGVQQKGLHQYDVFEHSFYSCDAVPAEKKAVRFAALFHDIGKVETIDYDEIGVVTFYQHEKTSVRLTRNIMRRLKFPRDFEEQVLHLIANHMFHYEDIWTDAAVRRFIAKVGKEYLDDLFLLRRADQYGTFGKPIDPVNLKAFRKHIDKVLAEAHALKIADLAVNGHDLIKIGIPKGPAIGIVLRELLETVIDDPSQNSRPILLTIATNFYKQIS